MKIEKAIELNTDVQHSLTRQKLFDHAASVKLGIEALELIQRERLLGINPVETQLPGETPAAEYFEYQAKDELPPTNIMGTQ